MKYDNQLRHAAAIINAYDGKVPLATWLKDFFREHRQMGSNDRKTLAELVYGYFRLGHNQFDDIESRLLAGAKQSGQLTALLEHFAQRMIDLPPILPEKIFPWTSHLSAGVEPAAFSQSFLTKPDLFLRIRPGRRDEVLSKLGAANLHYTIFDDDCLELENATKVGSLLKIDGDVVVQDKSSQRTGNMLKGLQPNNVWDCCAGSGGKSIMAVDKLENFELTVTDKRRNVMSNLETRFREAGINSYHSFVADLDAAPLPVAERSFDLVIADAPCTGSGTWSRTPEQLYFFKKENIDVYASRQKRIMNNVLPAVRNGGHLLYITCSVFREENEEVMKSLLSHQSVTLEKQVLISGYKEKADTLFAALFTVGQA